MGPHAHNIDLYLKKFATSLIDRVYTWHVNLKPGKIRNWSRLVSLFSAKFLYANAKFTLVELGRARQYSGEDVEST